MSKTDRLQTLGDFPARMWLVYDGTCHEKKKISSDCGAIWEGEWNREREQGDRFHKVPCVRLLSHAKRNITSTALIKEPTEKRKNNDARATALLRKDWQKKYIQSQNPIQLQCLSYPRVLCCISFTLYINGLTWNTIHLKFKSNSTWRHILNL